MNQLLKHFKACPYKAQVLGVFFLFIISFVGYKVAKSRPASDNAAAQELPVAIILNGNFYLDFIYQNVQGTIPYWVFYKDGHYISYYPIITGALNTPRVYLEYKRKGSINKILPDLEEITRETSILLSSLSVSFMFLILLKLKLSTQASFIFSIIFAFTTNFYTIGSQSFWQHVPSVCFLLIAIWACLIGGRVLFIAGLCLGIAVFNRPANAVFALPLCFYVICCHKDFFWFFFSGAFIPAVLLFTYSYEYWGTIQALGQGHGMQREIDNPYYHYDAIGFKFPIVKGIINHVFSPSRGLLVYTPVFVLSFVQLFKLIVKPKQNPLIFTLCISLCLHIILLSKWTAWHGGWSYGYRLLTELIPILIILLALFWQQLLSSKYHWKKVICIIFLVISSSWGGYIQYLGTQKFDFSWSQQKLPQSNAEHAEIWWDFKSAQWLFYQKK